MGPGDLNEALKDFPLISHPNLIVGMEHSEDAGVYKLNDELAIIQTLDFFTPIVDDPYTFGQIAVANALSDVYAMGGKPLTAMNVVCFPIHKMDISVLRLILQGGLDKMREAEVLLVGGHSVMDNEPKYGLSVTGVVHPERVLLNRGAKVGDKLILTKPIGTGIISTAIKGGLANDELVSKTIKSMTTLNKKAMEIMTQTTGIHACTDVSGFGFLGHASEMIEGSEVGMVIYAAEVPIFNEIRELVEMGMVPGGLYRNRKYRENMIVVEHSCPDWLADALFDPQTSGGLLIALSGMQADRLLADMRQNGIAEAQIVGEIVAGPKGKIRVI